jgi:hypothetical protein
MVGRPRDFSQLGHMLGCNGQVAVKEGVEWMLSQFI